MGQMHFKSSDQQTRTLQCSVVKCEVTVPEYFSLLTNGINNHLKNKQIIIYVDIHSTKQHKNSTKIAYFDKTEVEEYLSLSTFDGSALFLSAVLGTSALWLTRLHWSVSTFLHKTNTRNAAYKTLIELHFIRH